MIKQLLQSKSFFIILFCLFIYLFSGHIIEKIQSNQPEYTFKSPPAASAFTMESIISTIHFTSIIMLSSALIISGIACLKKKKIPIIGSIILISGILFCLYWANLSWFVHKELKTVSIPFIKARTTYLELKTDLEKRLQSPPTEKNVFITKQIARIYHREFGICLNILTDEGKIIRHKPLDEDTEYFQEKEATLANIFYLQNKTKIKTIILLATIPSSFLAGLMLLLLKKKPVYWSSKIAPQETANEKMLIGHWCWFNCFFNSRNLFTRQHTESQTQ